MRAWVVGLIDDRGVGGTLAEGTGASIVAESLYAAVEAYRAERHVALDMPLYVREMAWPMHARWQAIDGALVAR